MRWLLTSLFLLGFVQGTGWAEPGAARLTAAEIIERFIERNRTVTNRLAEIRQSFVRRTVIEEFEGSGKLKERKSKEHRVELLGLEQRLTLLKLNDRAPSPEELLSEQNREAENQQRFATRSDRVRRRNNVDYLDERLIRRFRYELTGFESIGGRGAFRLQFRPDGEEAGEKFADRVISRLAGEIWIDAEDFELVKLDAKLAREFTVWGGVVASLNRLDFTLVRQRLADGTWVNLALSCEAAGRKVFSAFRGRLNVQQEDFQSLPAANASP